MANREAQGKRSGLQGSDIRICPSVDEVLKYSEMAFALDENFALNKVVRTIEEKNKEISRRMDEMACNLRENQHKCEESGPRVDVQSIVVEYVDRIHHLEEENRDYRRRCESLEAKQQMTANQKNLLQKKLTEAENLTDKFLSAAQIHFGMPFTSPEEVIKALEDPVVVNKHNDDIETEVQALRRKKRVWKCAFYEQKLLREQEIVNFETSIKELKEKESILIKESEEKIRKASEESNKYKEVVESLESELKGIKQKHKHEIEEITKRYNSITATFEDQINQMKTAVSEIENRSKKEHKALKILHRKKKEYEKRSEDLSDKLIDFARKSQKTHLE